MSIARGVTLLTPGRARGAEGAAIPERLGRVLLVEDERDVAELIRYNLVKEGCDIETVRGVRYRFRDLRS